jgi:hypothetical protein
MKIYELQNFKIRSLEASSIGIFILTVPEEMTERYKIIMPSA